MIYFLSCIVASKAKLEFELVKLCALFIAIFYMCSLQNESEYVICNSCKTEEADNTWYFIGCGQLQNGSGFMPFSFNILQG